MVKATRPKHFYLLVEVDAAEVGWEAYRLRELVRQAMRHLYGGSGAEEVVEVLKWDRDTYEGTLRVASESVIALRAALAFVTAFEGRRCGIAVRACASNAASLSSSHRHLDLEAFEVA